MQSKLQYTHTIPRKDLFFFTHIIYHNPIRIRDCKEDRLPMVLLLVTGIADPIPLRIYLETNGHKVAHLAFPDHHWFSYTELLQMIRLFHSLSHPDKAIVITEKDYVRLIDHQWWKLLAPLPIFYISMEIGFSQESAEAFKAKIIETIQL